MSFLLLGSTAREARLIQRSQLGFGTSVAVVAHASGWERDEAPGADLVVIVLQGVGLVSFSEGGQCGPLL